MKISIRWSKKQIYALCLGVVVFVAIVVGIVVSRDTTSSQVASTDKVITQSTDDPDETPIGDDFVWKGGDADPKYISLPTIKGGGFLQKVGVDQRKEVGVPSNIHLAAWFTKSSLPGANGLSIIDGHVDGKSQPGVFKNLAKLQVGDKFTIEYGSGKETTFAVQKVSTIDEADAASVLFSADLGVASQLNLITCGGKYDSKARHYKQRVIVTSAPV